MRDVSPDLNDEGLPDFVKTLFRDKQMIRFKKFIKELDYQVSQSSKDAEKDKFQRIMDLIWLDIEDITIQNKEDVSQMFKGFKDVYERAFTDKIELQDNRVISAENMGSFGLEFLSWVDSRFVQDVNQNLDWYLNSYRENH